MRKRSLGKCILASNVWYTPPEFEALGGKRARRWKQSLLHIGKYLDDYDLSCPQQFNVSTISQDDCEVLFLNTMEVIHCLVLILFYCPQHVHPLLLGYPIRR